jgi:translin
MNETLEKIIKDATKEIRDREKARDEVFSRARKVRMLSKQAIQYLHSKELWKANDNLEEASIVIGEIIDYSKKHEEVNFFNQVEDARQEFAEASILFSINKKETVPPPETLKIPYTDYLLGLADVPGELRRQVLNQLQKDSIEEARNSLLVMEEIYLQLTAMEEGSLLLKGMRRKMDIIRTINEKTLADITNHLSRKRLIEKLDEFTRKLS